MSVLRSARTGVTVLVLGWAVLAGGATPSSAADCYPPSQAQCSPSPTPHPTGPPSEHPTPQPTDHPTGKPTDTPRPVDPKGGPDKTPKPTKSAKPPKTSTQVGTGSNAQGQQIQLGSAFVAPGDPLHVSSSGWQPGSTVRLELHSTPVVLGTYLADSAGNVNATTVIPTSTTTGRHSVVAFGVAPTAAAATVSAAVNVTTAGGGDPQSAPTRGSGIPGVSLPRTGAEITLVAMLGLALAGSGIVAVRAGRRRRLTA
jgi:LPXTG-motif cell wall-anchored protein